MSSFLRCTVLLLSGGLTFTPQVFAQEEPKAQFEEELLVTEVLLDVLVTDASGNVIMGLEKGDFIVMEEGEGVELNSATFYSNRSFLMSSPLAEELGIEDEIPVDRYFILFFHDQRHDLSGLVAQQLDAARWSERWVREELLRNDYVAVVSYDHKLKVHQDFTTDKSAILQGIRGVAKGKDPGHNWPSRQPQDSGPSLLKNLPQGKELRRQTTRIYDGLQLLGEAAGTIIGRKNLLLFSIGFGEVNEFGNYTPDARYYPDMMEALNDDNIAVYAIDMIPISEGGSLNRSLNDSLSLLASDTGGQYYFNFNNFLTPLRRVAEDNNGYYLLSYTSEYAAASSGYKHVKVTTRNPQFKVRARKGYRYGS